LVLYINVVGISQPGVEAYGVRPSLIRTLKNSNIVTVGEADTFAKQGGMIQFITIENKLRFIINLKAAKAAGFDLDSRLLSLALELIK